MQGGFLPYECKTFFLTVNLCQILNSRRVSIRLKANVGQADERKHESGLFPSDG